MCWGEFSWPKFVELLPAYVSALAAVGAVVVAWIQLRALRTQSHADAETARAQSAKQHAVDFLADQSLSSEMHHTRREFGKLVDRVTAGEIAEVASAFAKREQDKDDFALENAFQTVMNRYELAAIAIQEGAMDEAYYKRMERGDLIRDFRRVEPLIQALRIQRENPNIYSEVEKLYRRWSTDDQSI